MGNAEISCCTRKNQKSKAAVSNLNVSSKGPASTLAKKTERILRKCRICFIAYNDQDHFPMMVGKCGHTICKACIETQTKCPLCLRDINPQQVIKNYGMLEVEDEEELLKSLGLKKNEIRQRYIDSNSSVESERGALKISDKEKPNQSPPLKVVADKLYSLRRYDNSLSYYNECLRTNPKNLKCLNGRVRCLIALNQYEQALEVCNKLIVLEPGKSSYLKNRGICFSKLSKFSQAVFDFTKAISLSNKSKYYKDRALIYMKMDKQQEALADLNQAIRLEPTSSVLYKYRASIYDKLNKPEEAVADRASMINYKEEKYLPLKLA